MAGDKAVLSLDDMIQADRQRRRDAELANEIFGKKRKINGRGGPVVTGRRQPSSGPSMASRVGITKGPLRPAASRSVSSTPRLQSSIDTTWGHDLHHTNDTKAARVSRLSREMQGARAVRENPPYDMRTIDRGRNGIDMRATVRGNGNGMSIRGIAGPYVVVGSNFAPGTTSADIESAMVPLGGEMQSCKIITSSPTVIAEMVFTEKAGAENVIATFNNQKADGRVLHVYMKVGPPTPAATNPPTRFTPTEPRASRPEVARTDDFYEVQREQSDRHRRQAEPEFHDGRYGFEARDEKMDLEMDDGSDSQRDNRREIQNRPGRDNRRLYSDDLYPQRRGRGFR